MNREIEAELKQLHHESKLCLFVGAGVSESCGLPDWNTLSAKVIGKTWPDKVEGIDIFGIIKRGFLADRGPLEAMRMARRIHKGNFNSIVSKCLYSKGVNLSHTVEAIVSLQHVRRICCFNFDDLLEEGYKKDGAHFSFIDGR